ncbi:MAG: hypothetical protein H0W73_01795 [Bacteroidetes bacterium]|nr:hypothetical protein [Bacteroidota bacterium]
MVHDLSKFFNLGTGLIGKKSVFILTFFFFLSVFAFAQNPVAEVYSGRIHNSEKGSSFYFRILDVNETDFENYYKKSKEFTLFNNFKSGYSLEYKIGSLYYSSSKAFNLLDIHSLLKYLGFSQVKYDNAVISVNDLPNKPIVTPERNSGKQVRTN